MKEEKNNLEFITEFVTSLFAPAIEKVLDEKLELALAKFQASKRSDDFEEDLITIPDFARTRNISLPTAHKYLNKNSDKIKRYRFGGRKVWLRKSEIEAAFLSKESTYNRK